MSISSESDLDASVRTEAPPSGSGAVPVHELRFRNELKRKTVHLLALTLPLGMVVLGRTGSLAVLGPLTAVAIGADVLRARSETFSRRIEGIFGSMMRPEERPGIGGRPVLNGATWVLISATLLALLFPIRIAVISFTTFMIADAAAAVFGRRFGRRKWPSSARTVEGSAAFAAAGALVMFELSDASIAVVAATVLAGALLEIPRRPFNDNIRVPLGMAVVLLLLGS